jgi:hypothetical protein
MPDLPTLTVSQAHFDRLVQAFPGETMLDKADAYKAWLINRLIERVETVESIKIDMAAQQAKSEALATMHESLPDRVPEPAMPGINTPSIT